MHPSAAYFPWAFAAACYPSKAENHMHPEGSRTLLHRLDAEDNPFHRRHKQHRIASSGIIVSPSLPVVGICSCGATPAVHPIPGISTSIGCLAPVTITHLVLRNASLDFDPLTVDPIIRVLC